MKYLCRSCKQFIELDWYEAHYGRCAKKLPWGWIIFVLICLLAFGTYVRNASADEIQSEIFKCAGYGRLVECRAEPSIQKFAKMWATTRTEGEEALKDNAPYRAGGDSFTFNLKDKELHTIELHLLDAKNLPIYRQWCFWGKDPKDGVWKVLFTNSPEKPKVSRPSPSMTKQASKDR